MPFFSEYYNNLGISGHSVTEVSYLSFTLRSVVRLLYSLGYFIYRLLLFVSWAFHLRFVIQDVVCVESKKN